MALGNIDYSLSFKKNRLLPILQEEYHHTKHLVFMITNLVLLLYLKYLNY